MTPTETKVLLVDADSERAGVTRDMLAQQGYAIAGIVGGTETLPERLATGDVDTVIVYTSRVDETLTEQLATIPDPLRRPVVLLTEDAAPTSIHNAVAAGVNAFIIVGVSGNRMRSAIDLARANFSNTSGLREELDEVRTALRERKAIERAKGIIMKEKGLFEEDAYALLRTRAMQKGVRIVEIATMINEAAEVMEF